MRKHSARIVSAGALSMLLVNVCPLAQEAERPAVGIVQTESEPSNPLIAVQQSIVVLIEAGTAKRCPDGPCGMYTVIGVDDALYLVTTPHVAALELTEHSRFLWFDFQATPKVGAQVNAVNLREIAPAELGINRNKPGWQRAGDSEVSYLRIKVRDKSLGQQLADRAMKIERVNKTLPAPDQGLRIVYVWPWNLANREWWPLGPETSVAGPATDLLWTDNVRGTPVAKNSASAKPRLMFPIAKDTDNIYPGMSGAPLVVLGPHHGAIVGILYGNVNGPSGRPMYALAAPVVDLYRALSSKGR